MKSLPDDLRLRLGALRVCRANGIIPRVLVHLSQDARGCRTALDVVRSMQR